MVAFLALFEKAYPRCHLPSCCQEVLLCSTVDDNQVSLLLDTRIISLGPGELVQGEEVTGALKDLPAQGARLTRGFVACQYSLHLSEYFSPDEVPVVPSISQSLSYFFFELEDFLLHLFCPLQYFRQDHTGDNDHEKQDQGHEEAEILPGLVLGCLSPFPSVPLL